MRTYNSFVSIFGIPWKHVPPPQKNTDENNLIHGLFLQFYENNLELLMYNWFGAAAMKEIVSSDVDIPNNGDSTYDMSDRLDDDDGKKEQKKIGTAINPDSCSANKHRTNIGSEKSLCKLFLCI